MGTSQHPRSKVVRQDRIAIEDLRSYFNVESENFPVINYSTFGIALELPRNVELGWQCTGTLKVENIEICVCSLRVVRVEKSDGHFRVAFEVTGGEIDTERVSAVSEALRGISSLNAEISHFSSLPSEYKLRVYELKDTLLRFERKIDELERQRKMLSSHEREAFEKSIIDVMAPPVHNSIRECNLQLSEIIAGKPAEQLKLGFEFFRNQLKDLIYKSPFAERSYTKPLGYAGDYEMMNLIYRNEDFGLSLFGRCMERAMQMHMEPGAVRNRASYLKTKIRQFIEAFYPRQLNILSVASGPAFELKEIVESLSQQECDRVEFHLLDQDIVSLKSAQRAVLGAAKQRGLSVKLNLINKPIRQIISEGIGKSDFDLIYSAGLFDYFSDSVAKRAAQILFESLSNDGQLIIGNFASSTPNQFGMLTLFDWHLILRSKEDLRQLFRFEGSKLNIESEPNGINLFCVIRRE